MKNIRYLPLVLPLLSLAFPAQGPRQDQEPDPEQVLERLLRRLDDNGDGRISREEFPGPGNRFRRLDRNRDGFFDRRDLPGGSRKTTPGVVEPKSDAEALAFFEERIRPVLADNCYRCHSTDGDKIKGGLLLDSRETMVDGGTSGPAVVPGNPDASLIVIAIRYTDEELEMPPKKALPGDVVRDFERWVEMGAPWPAAPEASVQPLGEHGMDIEAGRAWWAFQPPVESTVPQVKDEDWAWNDVDRFLLAEMEKQGVRPVGDADDLTWLRRVSLDLVGLPPTPEEQDAFQSDRSPERFEHVVDRLLASPQFGERWGRHWLDIARYAESSGRDSNIVYPHAWRYRDYVIEAFDRDVPFDRFLIEQIAGDLQPAEDATERAMLDIATGYLAIGSKSHNTRDRRQFAADLADEQVDTVSQGMLGMTISCARCHDHKFDPIPAEDYYALAGIFRSSETFYGTFSQVTNKHPSTLLSLPEEARVSDGTPMESGLLRLVLQQKERLEKEYADAPKPQRRGRREQMSADSEREDPGDGMQVNPVRVRIIRDQLRVYENLLQRFDEEGQPTEANRVAMGLREGSPGDAPLLLRGEIEAVGPLVPRGVPQVLSLEGVDIPQGSSGRLELARWIGSPDNPLTARVWSNRVWLHLFGRGIVSTPNNFGASGQLPSHPELLDWLAVTFMEQDAWSTKSLIRRVVLSHAYHLEAGHDTRNARIDPEAIYLWRMPERRLDAEVIRDSMLYAAGILELERPVGSVINIFEGQTRGDRYLSYLTRPTRTRSVYLSILRDRLPESMQVFDAADPSFVTSDRQETNVATQALYLMNDEEVMQAADGLARRLRREETSTTKRISLAFELALGRKPGSDETRIIKSFLKDYEKLPVPKTEAPERRRPGSGRARRSAEAEVDPEFEAWSAFAQALYQSAEFRYGG